MHHYWLKCDYREFLSPQDLPRKCKVLTRVLQGLLGIWDMLMFFTCPQWGGIEGSITAWSGKQQERDKGLVSPAHKRVLLGRMWSLHRVCTRAKPLMWVQAEASKDYAEGEGEAKKQKAAGDLCFLKQYPWFSSGLFLWAFLKMLALHSLCVTVLTDQTRRCCEYSITPNWLLISVNPKHADTVRIKCICSHFWNEQGCCNAVQYVNAPNRLIQLFWKVLSCVHMLDRWRNGEMCV